MLDQRSCEQRLVLRVPAQMQELTSSLSADFHRDLNTSTAKLSAAVDANLCTHKQQTRDILDTRERLLRKELQSVCERRSSLATARTEELKRFALQADPCSQQNLCSNIA